jgi:hypothetical protein
MGYGRHSLAGHRRRRVAVEAGRAYGFLVEVGVRVRDLGLLRRAPRLTLEEMPRGSDGPTVDAGCAWRGRAATAPRPGGGGHPVGGVGGEANDDSG